MNPLDMCAGVTIFLAFLLALLVEMKCRMLTLPEQDEADYKELDHADSYDRLDSRWRLPSRGLPEQPASGLPATGDGAGNGL